MNKQLPTTKQWKELYKAAIKFQRMECWNWMWDTDIFGVQNPENGEIGYCCIMGGAEEHFALAVYLGSEGLYGYLELQSKKDYPSLGDMLSHQNLLMASFEDKYFLQKEDLQIIQKIGLKVNPSHLWPIFRSYQPGYHPWFLTAAEAKYLTLCLHQAMELAIRFKQNPDLLTPRTHNHYLVRVPKKEANGFTWKDLWIEPLPLAKNEIILKSLDKELLNQINRKNLPHQGIWEADFFYYPRAVQDKGGRPYFPYVFFWVDHHSGFILDHYLAKPDQCFLEFQQQFYHIAMNMKTLPQEILVKKEETFKLIEPIASELKINLRRVKNLKMLDSAKASMLKFINDEEE
jgi:hypothetical protein